MSAESDVTSRSRLSRPVLLLLALAAVAVAGVLSITALVIFEFRAREIEEAKSELARLDLSPTEQTARSFQSVDLILSSILDQMKADGIDSAADYAAKMSGRNTYELLQAKTV